MLETALRDATTNEDERLSRSVLEGDQPRLELLTDSRRPARASSCDAFTETSVGRDVAEKIRHVAASLDASPSTSLLTAFFLLLSRSTDQNDLVIGTSVQHRVRASSRLVPVRVRIEPNETFVELSAQVRAALERSIPQGQANEADTGSRVFDISFSYCEVSDTVRKPSETTFPFREVDLALDVRAETDGTMSCSFAYCSALFNRSTVTFLAAHFGVLLGSIARRPDAPIERLELADSAELDMILNVWSHPDPLPTGFLPELGARTIQELVARCAAKLPNAVALIQDDVGPITYRELERSSNRLAHALRERGVVTGSCVGIYAERSIDAVIAMLAILKAGAAYVPLDPDFPSERTSYMIEAAAVQVIVARAELFDTLAEHGRPLIDIETSAHELCIADYPPSGNDDPDGLAYVIFTSGSTGKPKAVPISHRGVIALATRTPLFACGPEDTVLLHATLTFDASVVMIWPTLIYGARLAVMPAGPFALTEFESQLRAYRVTALDLPAAFFHQLVEERIDALRGLRRCIANGDVLSPVHCERFIEMVPECRLFNGYGPTEITVAASFHEVRPGIGSRRAVPVGRPTADARLYILDTLGRPVATGVPGDLYIGGVGVSRGYLNEPELTRERFVPDPFSSTTYALLYRSGDRARWLPGGELEFLGRCDDEVKIRGFRIQPAEIEFALLEHPMVRHAAVVMRGRVRTERNLVAYAEVRDAQTNEELLRAFLCTKLPAYMMPTRIVVLDELPKTSSGKIDRSNLPGPTIVVQCPDELPLSETEQIIASIIGGLLSADHVARSDDFFAIGGHSLLATRVLARIADAFKVEISLRSFMDSPSIEGLAALITSSPSHALPAQVMSGANETVRSSALGLVAQLSIGLARTQEAAIEPRSEPLADEPLSDEPKRRALLAKLRADHPVPLSFGQRSLWLADELDPASAIYNVSSAYRLRGAVDIAALEEALNGVLQRHDVLRSILSLENGEPVMRTVASFRLALCRRDITSIAQLESILATESERGFDLHREPPIRATLLRIADEENVLLVTMHHIATDGWSSGVFNRELGLLYGELVDGTPAALPHLTYRYADFVREQQETISDRDMKRTLTYWQTKLKDAPGSVEFVAQTRSDISASAAVGATESIVISAMLRDALAQLARRQRVTLFTALLSIWYTVLERYTGQRDLTVGSALANRRRTAVEAIVGYFVNTVPLRARITEGLSFADLLAQVHATTLEAFEHQDVPLELLVKEINPTRLSARTPLFNVFFVLQNTPNAALDLAGLMVEPERVLNGTAGFDLALQVTECDAGLNLDLEYRSELFPTICVRAMLEAFEELLAAVVRDPQAILSELPVITEAERSRQLDRSKGIFRPLSGLCIDKLFERQVEKAPDRVALVSGNVILTYRSLNERANQLARYLRSSGVRRGSPVGIALERGAGMITGLLAILKAGGVYVPLDPQYPLERLALLAGNAETNVVLTDSRSLARLKGLFAKFIDVDVNEAWLSEDRADLDVEGTGDDAAYVMFTSGSTGSPKGVRIAHRGIERLAIDSGYGTIRPQDVMAQIANLSFDGSTEEIWCPLLNGASVVIVTSDAFLAPDALAACIAANGITIMCLAPALFGEIVRKAPSTFRELRVLLVGGDKLDPESVRLLCEDSAPIQLVNSYGPTETTTTAATFTIDLRDPVPDNIPIGSPICNTELLILDKGLQLLPHGACGQLYVGGSGIALGYVGELESGRESFIKHPFAANEERLYATGDQVRYRTDGNIEYLGRMDSQIKVRGYRIEPGEIETALRACDEVSDAFVFQRLDNVGNPRLVGYVSSESTSPHKSDELMSALVSRLPAHLIPDAIVVLPALPLTNGGKIDRRALPPPPSRCAPADARMAATDELQLEIVQLWEELLGVHPIGIRDNFFALGGHSLLVVRLVSEISRRFDVRLALSIFFDQPTIERVTEMLRRENAGHKSQLVAALNTSGTKTPLFFMHGMFVQGGGSYCLALAEHLGDDRPLFVMRPQGVDGDPIPPTIEAIASSNIALLKSVVPEGPYLLGGFCSAGLVAFEMAHQLVERGECVDNVIMIDAPHAWSGLRPIVDLVEAVGRVANVSRTRVASLSCTLSRIAYHLASFPEVASKRDFLRLTLSKIGVALNPAQLRERTNSLASPDSSGILSAWGWLSEGYVPARYAGRVALLITEEAQQSTNAAKGWLASASQVEIRRIPGDHITSLTDHLGTTSNAVAAAL